MSILKTLRKWVTGKSDEDDKKKKRDALRVTNYGGGAARNDTKGEVKRSIQKAEKAKTQAATSSSAFKATPPSVKKAEAKDKQTKPTQSAAFKASTFAPKHQSTALGTVSEKEAKARTAKKNAFEANQKEKSRAADKLKPLINEKYSTRKTGAPAYAKQGNYAADPDVAKYNVLKHPVATSATRGALSGTTLGLSDLAISKLSKGEAKEAEQFYQANKDKFAEGVGTFAGAMLPYAGTAKAFESLGAKAVGRAAETQVGKRLGAEALAKTMAGKGAKSALARSLVGDAIQDSTIGLVDTMADVAQRDDLKTVGDYLKAIGKGQLANYGMGLAGNVVSNIAPALKSLDGATDRGVRVTADDLAARAARNIDNNADRINIRDMARQSAPNVDAQIDDAIDDLIASAKTTEDFMELFGFDRATAEILAADNARQASREAARAVSEAPQNGIPKGNIRPLAENLRANKELPRSRNREWRATPRSAKRVDTSIEGMTKQVDELKGKTWQTDRERRAIETKINDVEDRLDRAKWRREGGANMDAMRKAYRGEYAGFDMSKSTNSYQSDVLEGKIAGKTATIVEMSPDEYIERTYRQIFKKPTERAKVFGGIAETQKNVEKYAEAMRNGEKFPLPYLDYSAAQQEGRHRALAAKAAGIDKMPVVIIDNESNPKAIIDEVSEATAKATPKAELNEELAAKQAREVDEQVKEAVNNEYVERERNAKKISEKYRDYDKEIREATGGDFAVRKGVVSMGKGSNPKEQKKILAKMGRDVESVIKNSGAVEDGDFDTLLKTWNAGRKQSAMKNSYAKASEGVNNIADSIKAKVESFTKNPDNGTGIKIEDVFDMIAVKQVYKDNGMEMPEDLQEAFTKLILANKTEHAQGLSVIEQVLREFDPDYRKAFIRKDFEKFLSRFGNVESWDEVAASLDRNHKTEGYLQDKLQELVDFKVGENGTVDEYKKFYKDLQNEILRNSKPNLWNMLDSLRHTFMLSNFATAARNIYGNASQRIMYDISDALTAQFEASLERRIARNPEVAKKYGEGFERTTTSLIKSKDNRAFASLGRIREGKLGEGLSKITDDAAKAADSEYIKTLEKNLKEDVQDVMGYEKLMPHLEKGMDYAPKNAGEKLATKAYRLSQKGGKVVSFMLNEPDSWFVERNYRTALAKYLEANGITNMASLKGKEEVLKRAREHAKDVALENTYKKANRLTTFIERARAAGKKQGANPLQMAGSIALDAEQPYVKVPVNMFINNVKYSPVGIATNGWKAIKAAHIGDVQGLQKSVAELSKGVTGTGLAALGFMLACDENEQMDNDSIGIIAKANEALKEYGVRDNSIKVGGYNFNIADIGLGATQFLMGAAYAEALNENGGAPKGLLGDVNAVLDAFRSTFDVVGDLSLMDNFMQTIDAFSTGYGDDVKLSDRVENASMQILPNYVNQYIPNPLRAAAKGTTKADLDTGTKKGKDVSKLEKTLKRNINNQIQGIPVINEKGIKGTKFEGLPHKVDNHGNLISTGLYPEGRDTKKKKAVQALVNYADPLSTRRIKIPEADKVELKVKDENGKGYEAKAFDENREYKADIGTGKLKETIDLTGKEREKAATSMKKSGKDMARNLVDRGWFGDSHGKRAMEILSKVPEDEEKAREFFYNTTEFKRLSDEEKTKFFNDEYDKTKGRGRTANKAVYVDIKGNSEGDFRFTNDLNDTWKTKYDDYGIGQYGIDKGTFADIHDELAYAHHKYKDGKNVDTINTKGKTIATLLANEDLTREQRIAIYNAVRGNYRWKDWDGVSGAGGYYRRGWRRWRRWGRRGGSGKASAHSISGFKAKKASSPKPKRVSAPKTNVSTKSNVSVKSSVGTSKSNIKTGSIASAISNSGSRRGSSANYNTASVKYNTASAVKKPSAKKKTTAKVMPPKVKFKKYEV